MPDLPNGKKCQKLPENESILPERVKRWRKERVKALFQLRGIIAAMGLEPNSFPELRGDYIKETEDEQ